jgi:hypothetical protein
VIWATLLTSPSIEVAIDQLLTVFDMDRAILEKDVLDLLARLIALGLARTE